MPMLALLYSKPMKQLPSHRDNYTRNSTAPKRVPKPRDILPKRRIGSCPTLLVNCANPNGAQTTLCAEPNTALQEPCTKPNSVSSGFCARPANVARRLLLVVCLLMTAFTLVACNINGSSNNREPVVIAAPPYYDWDGFTKIGQRYTYSDGQTLADKNGIDVSEAQGDINWDDVRADGVRFAFIRVGYRGSTEGNIYLDGYYDYNIAGAKQAGVECGVYFFSQAITVEEAQEEAAFVLDTLGGMSLEYPVVFDYEMRASGINSRVSGVDSSTASAIADAFCEAVEAGGYTAMLYGNGYDLGHYAEDTLMKWPCWYAEYGALPSFTNAYTIWQYASDGSVKGIGTNVDLNLDLSDIGKKADRNTSQS